MFYCRWSLAFVQHTKQIFKPTDKKKPEREMVWKPKIKWRQHVLSHSIDMSSSSSSLAFVLLFLFFVNIYTADKIACHSCSLTWCGTVVVVSGEWWCSVSLDGTMVQWHPNSTNQTLALVKSSRKCFDKWKRRKRENRAEEMRKRQRQNQEFYPPTSRRRR